MKIFLWRSLPRSFTAVQATLRRLDAFLFRFTMRPPPGDLALQELDDYLIKWRQVCDSIERTMSEPTNSPLVRMAQSHLLKFVAKVRSVANCITDADFCTPGSEAESLQRCYYAVVSLEPALLAALEALDFCRTQERHGHDGELNALYARLNFEGTTGPDAARKPATWKDKARAARIEQRLGDLTRLPDDSGMALLKPERVREEIQSFR